MNFSEFLVQFVFSIPEIVGSADVGRMLFLMRHSMDSKKQFLAAFLSFEFPHVRKTTVGRLSNLIFIPYWIKIGLLLLNGLYNEEYF